MFNNAYIGKNLDEVKTLLKNEGITDIEVVRNDTRGEYEYDIDLVVRCEISLNKATIIVSKFKLNV